MGLMLVNVNIVIADVTFSDENASKIIVDLEKGKICSQLYTSANEINNVLAKQVGIYQQQLQLCNEKETSYEDAIKTKDLIIKTQLKQCEDLIKEAKGTFWSRLKNNLEVYGIGALTGMVVLGILIIAL
jgi:hypothetical protein